MTGSGVVSSSRSSAGPARSARRSATASRNAHVESGTTSATSALTSSSLTGSNGPVQRELVELADGERAHPLAVDVTLADEAADPTGELLRRARLELHLALGGSGGRSSRRARRPWAP